MHIYIYIHIITPLLYQNSLLDPAAVERERDVILREMEEVRVRVVYMVYIALYSICITYIFSCPIRSLTLTLYLSNPNPNHITM